MSLDTDSEDRRLLDKSSTRSEAGVTLTRTAERSDDEPSEEGRSEEGPSEKLRSPLGRGSDTRIDSLRRTDSLDRRLSSGKSTTFSGGALRLMTADSSEE
jgi:hypothetical protein